MIYKFYTIKKKKFLLSIPDYLIPLDCYIKIATFIAIFHVKHKTIESKFLNSLKRQKQPQISTMKSH